MSLREVELSPLHLDIMRHLRLAFDWRFWEAAENLLQDLHTPEDDDEGFSEPLTLQDLVELESPNAVDYFFPDADVPLELPTDAAAEELLRCDEEVVDLSTLFDSETESPPGSPFSAVELDYPEHPGHNCSACDYHRRATRNEETLCSLCYMRKNAFAVYGKRMFALHLK